jgi:hypothetical protein
VREKTYKEKNVIVIIFKEDENESDKNCGNSGCNSGFINRDDKHSDGKNSRISGSGDWISRLSRRIL